MVLLFKKFIIISALIGVILVPFGVVSCAKGVFHVPLFMSDEYVGKCSESLVLHLQKLSGTLNLLLTTVFLIVFVIFYIIKIPHDSVVKLDSLFIKGKLYCQKLLNFIGPVLSFLSFKTIAVQGLMPCKRP